MARMAALDQASPQRCGLRARSCAEGLGMPSREMFGDRVQALAPPQILVEDAGDDGRGRRVGFQAMETMPGRCLAWVGVRAQIGESVAVGRAAAEEAALGGGLSRHRRADVDLDAVAFALGHAAVQ